MNQVEFKEKDRVYHYNFGIGKVVYINKSKGYLVYVDFGCEEQAFTLDGIWQEEEPPTRSFTPYNLETGGFSQERPKLEGGKSNKF